MRANPSRAVVASRAGEMLWRGSLWAMAGTAAGRGGNLIAAILLARILGPQLFGEYGVLESTVAMFALVASAGQSLTCAKFVAKYRLADPARAGRVLGLCLSVGLLLGAITASLVWFGAGWIARVGLRAPGLSDELQIAAVVILFSSINGAINGALMGFQAFKRSAQISVAMAAATVTILTAAAVARGASGALMGLLIVQAVTSLVLFTALRQLATAGGVTITLRGSWRERGLLASFSLPAFVNATLTSPVNWLCLTMLVNRSDGYAQIGLLHAINPWFLLMMFVPGQLANVYYPMLEEAHSRRDRVALRDVMWRTTRVNTLIAIAMAAGLLAAAAPILACYGGAYRDAVGLMRVAVATGLIVALQQPLNVYLVATVNMWVVTACSAGWALVFVATSFSLLPHGAVGIAGARLLAYCVFAASVAAVAYRTWRRTSAEVATPLDVELQAA